MVLMAFMLMYSYQKAEILINKKDAKIFYTEQVANITDNEVFDTKMGLKIAVALVSWGEITEIELTKEYGEIAFYRNAWTTDDNGTLVNN